MFHDLICVSYCGGAGGNAVACLISLSPEIKQTWRADHINPDDAGATHPPSRFIDADGKPFDMVRLHARLGYEYYDRSKDLPTDIKAAYADSIPQLRINQDGQLLSDALASGRIVMADHTLPIHQLQVWPNAKVVAVYADWRLSMRNFAQKYLLVQDWLHPSMSTIDAELTDGGHAICHVNRKSNMHQHIGHIKLTELLRTENELILPISFENMFSIDKSWESYHDLIRWLGLTPRWDLAEPWISNYIRLQPKRN